MDPHYYSDLHATILQQLSVNHTKLEIPVFGSPAIDKAIAAAAAAGGGTVLAGGTSSERLNPSSEQYPSADHAGAAILGIHRCFNRDAMSSGQLICLSFRFLDSTGNILFSPLSAGAATFDACQIQTDNRLTRTNIYG